MFGAGIEMVEATSDYRRTRESVRGGILPRYTIGAVLKNLAPRKPVQSSNSYIRNARTGIMLLLQQYLLRGLTRKSPVREIMIQPPQNVPNYTKRSRVEELVLLGNRSARAGSR